MSITKLTNLVNPEVMGQMISSELPKAIKFSPIARIDKTLAGLPGDTITVPKYQYIGDADDLVEGVAMGTVLLTTTTTKATIKQAGKGVEITDKSVLAGYGDPVGEAKEQLKKSIAAKVDNDCLDALYQAKLLYDGITSSISYEGIVNALDLFEDETDDDNDEKYLYVHPKQVTQLRLDPEFKDATKYPMNTVMTGVVGLICGCEVIKSKKIKLNTAGTGYENVIIKKDALAIYLKRDIEIEDGRDIEAKTTIITADEYYVAVLENESRAIKATFKK